MKFLLGLGLTVSILFNVFFFAGYLGSQRDATAAAPEAESPVNQVADALGLDDEQRSAFAALRKEVADEHARIDADIAVALETIRGELAASSPDRDRLDTLIANLTDLRDERHAAGAPAFGQLIEMLNPDQRERLHRRLDPRRDDDPRSNRDDRRRKLLEKFDTNGDGTLDESEQRAMRTAWMEEKQRRREQALQKLFDRDENGTLDDEEASALATFVEAYDATLARTRRTFIGLFDLDEDGTLDRGERQMFYRLLSEDGLVPGNRGERSRNRGRRNGAGRDAGPDGPPPGRRDTPGPPNGAVTPDIASPAPVAPPAGRRHA